MLELVENLLDFFSTVDFNLKVVSCVRQISCDDQEPLVDLIERNSHFKFLMWRLTILFVFSHWYCHLPYIMRFIRKLDDIGWLSLLRAPRAFLLSHLIGLASVWST